MSDQGAADKKVVRVVIFQQPYTLRSAGTPGETESLAAGVDQLQPTGARTRRLGGKRDRAAQRARRDVGRSLVGDALEQID